VKVIVAFLDVMQNLIGIVIGNVEVFNNRMSMCTCITIDRQTLSCNTVFLAVFYC